MLHQLAQWLRGQPVDRDVSVNQTVICRQVGGQEGITGQVRGGSLSDRAGTIEHKARERVDDGTQIDRRADIYAPGCTTLEWFSRRSTKRESRP